MPSIGPSLPPTAGPSIPQRSSTPSDDEDDFGPALPPHLLAARNAKAAGPSLPTLGPALPSAAYDQGQDSESDDDIIGPMPSAGGVEEPQSAVQDFLEREARWAKEREEASKPKVMKREEWMLVPPEAGDLAAATDPLRKRATAFNRTAAAPVSSQDQTLWTETPAEKQQRIADEVMGKKRKATDVRGQGDDSVDAERKRRRDREIKQSVEKHNTSHRNTSLLDSHSKKSKKDEDGPPVIWDRDRDMGVTGKLLSDPERLAKIKEAKGLNDRFGHGKAGAYSM
ncbi:hypothetical protein P7C73_g4693, partial [Tremellales sp. Uapishka_1]